MWGGIEDPGPKWRTQAGGPNGKDLTRSLCRFLLSGSWLAGAVLAVLSFAAVLVLSVDIQVPGDREAMEGFMEEVRA